MLHLKKQFRRILFVGYKESTQTDPQLSEPVYQNGSAKKFETCTQEGFSTAYMFAQAGKKERVKEKKETQLKLLNSNSSYHSH